MKKYKGVVKCHKIRLLKLFKLVLLFQFNLFEISFEYE